MKVTFLGTGTSQGVPVIACDCVVCKSKDPRDTRLRTSILVQLNNKNFVVDTGPDFRQQMLRENVEKLDAVIFTHQHKDHVAGLDDIRAFNHKQKKHMDIYCSLDVEEALKREFSYVFSAKKYPGIPELNVCSIKNEPFYIDDIEIIPIKAMHYKLPVFGYRIQDFVFLTDVSSISKKEKEKMKGASVIVLDALRRKPHIAHLTLNDAVKLLEELKPDRGYLIHLSHYMGIHKQLQKELPSFIEPAYDGLVINI